MPTHELPWTTFHAELAMGIAALFGSVSVLSALRGRVVAMPSLTVFAAAVSMTPLLQLLVGTIRFAGDAILSSLYLFSFAMTVAISFHAARLWSGRRVLDACAWVVVLAAIASSGMALGQWQMSDGLPLLVNTLAPLSRPYANLLQPNLLATLLVLGLVGVACLFDNRRISAAVSLLTAALISFGLILAQSRAAWLELAVISLVVIAKRRALTGSLGLRHFAIGAMLLILAQLAWMVLDPLSAHPVARDATVSTASTGNRITHWHEMAVAMLRRPWSGYGWMGVVSAQYDVAAAFPATHEILGYSHNLVLDLLVCTGIPLGLIIVGWLLVWLWGVATSATDSTALLALVALMAMLSHAQVEYPLAYTYFLLPAGVLCGLLCADGPTASVRVVPAWLSPMLLCGAASLLFVVSVDYLTVEQQMMRLRFEQARIGLHAPQSTLPPIRLLSQFDALLQFARTPERKDMTELQLGEMRQTVARFPSGANMVRLAAALALNNQSEEAVQVLRRVCKLEPEATCQNLTALWAVLGARQPAIQRVTWPSA
ncbi:PglL family O-oligosaccharyltransferase [Rhizobacter sp. Root16D2]|nr:O-antigen ligase family protein [Rhizobacter sp. Root16D2]